MPKRLSDSLSVPDSIKRDLKKYEIGQDLLSITQLPGWVAVIELIENTIESAEKVRDEYGDSDPHELFRLHSEVRGMKALLKKLEWLVKNHTQFVDNPPESIRKYTI